MFMGLALVLVGTIFLLEKLGIVSGSIWGYVWPCLIIALGLSIVLGKRHWMMHWGSHGCCTPDDKEKK